MIVHTAALYGSCAVALIAMALTFGRRPRSFVSLWPFLVLAVLDALMLNAYGHLIVEWLLPLATTAAVLWFSRSDAVARWSRWGLLLVAAILCCHGWYLLGHGYATRRVGLIPGEKVESAWYTPLTGMRKVYRP